MTTSEEATGLGASEDKAAARIHLRTATVLTLKSCAIFPIETPQKAYKTIAKDLKAG